jgi:pseudaminic acid synthase
MSHIKERLFSSKINKSTYIVAEMSANHNQNIERAEMIVRAACDAGADAIKLQTYTPDTMTIQCDNEYFTIKDTVWKGRTLYDLYSEAHTPWEWHARLKRLANDLGMDCFSTPFDHLSVDFLEELQMPCHKVASFEVVDIPLLKKVASTGKPVIMSTGMSSLAEIDEAVSTLRDSGCSDLVLLKCTSAYPAPASESNLRTIPHLAEAFGCTVGLSDHTEGSAVAVAAVCLGAKVIEKHFTLSRKEGGPDSSFSMEPEEFTQMVKDIRTVEQALGKVDYSVTEKQKTSLVFRRSLFTVKAVAAGEKFTAENVRCIRPGYGLHSRFMVEILGRAASRDLPAGTPLNWDCLS